MRPKASHFWQTSGRTYLIAESILNSSKSFGGVMMRSDEVSKSSRLKGLPLGTVVYCANE